MALNDNIKKFREEKNLTQQQLADKLYVSRQTVCRWENGSRCPDLITAKKLALELDVSTVSYTHLDVYKRQTLDNRTTLQSDKPGKKSILRLLPAVFSQYPTQRPAPGPS